VNFPNYWAAPKRLTPGLAWHEHTPFAMFLVGVLKPEVIVELGTHTGDSYCALCQAVREMNLNDFFFRLGHRLTVQVERNMEIANLRRQLQAAQAEIARLTQVRRDIENTRSWRMI
jgi:hypothetical protein